MRRGCITLMRIAMADRDSIDGFVGDAPRLYGHYTEDSWRQMLAVMQAEGQIPRADLDVARLYTNRFVGDYNRFDRAAVIAAAQRAS
jgi:NitT/TauT family transport system substrate-binding protein